MRTRCALLVLLIGWAWLVGSVRAGELTTDTLIVNLQADLKGTVSIAESVTTSIVDTNNPILVLAFDNDSGGAVYDTTTNHNDGLAYGGYGYTNGRNGGSALVLDGTSGYVQIPATTQFQMSNYTLVAWIKTASAGSGRRRIISHQNESYWLMALNNNVLELGSYGAGVLSAKGSAVNSGTWRMVAVVRDVTAGLVRWNIDGADVTSQVATATAPDASTTTGIMVGRVHNGSEYYGGTLDDVRVYNQALSAPALVTLCAGTNTMTVTNASAFSVTVPTTITRLLPQGDIGMGDFEAGL